MANRLSGIQRRAPLLALGTSLALGACHASGDATSPGPTASDAGIANEAGAAPATGDTAARLPIEVLGPAGTRVTVSLTVAAPRGVPKLRFTCHACGFDDATLDADPTATKAELSLNGAPAVPVKRYTGRGPTAPMVGNADLAISKEAEAYGGIGGGYRTVRIELPLSGLHEGTNTLTFHHARQAPGSLGFRIVALDVVDGDGTPLLAQPLTEDDPARWPAGSADDATQGAALWTRRDSLYDAELDALDGQLGGGAMSGAMHAACADCHTRSGSDLKYFNYSSASIVARAEYHGLSASDGARIAAYIRQLPVPYVAAARPWNPPYQPGPGLDARPVAEWAAGAGLPAVLESDAAMAPYLFPSGTSRAQVAAVVDRFSTLNLRELPIALQLPDWNRWLPRVHPLDAFDTTADLVNRDERGTAVGGPYFEVLYERARQTPSVENITALRSGVERWLGNGATCYTQQVDNGPAWRAVDAKVLAELVLPPAHEPVLTAAECPTLRHDARRTRRLELAKNGLVAFVSVKQWELLHENGLESAAATAGRNTCIPHGGTHCIDASEPRGWTVDGFSVFMRAPHYVSYDSSELTNQDELVGTYETTAWYQLQLLLNPGYRRHPTGEDDPPMPYHVPYVVLFLDNLGARSGLQDSFRFWATYIKLRQQQTNGYYGVENGLDLRTAQPFYLYSDEFADTALRAGVGRELWGKLADALLTDLAADATNAPRATWDAARQNSVVQRADDPPAAIFCPFPSRIRGNVFASPGRVQGCNTYMVVPKLREAAIMPADGTGVDALITWSKAMWPSSDIAAGQAAWEALR